MRNAKTEKMITPQRNGVDMRNDFLARQFDVSRHDDEDDMSQNDNRSHLMHRPSREKNVDR